MNIVIEHTCDDSQVAVNVIEKMLIQNLDRV